MLPFNCPYCKTSCTLTQHDRSSATAIIQIHNSHIWYKADVNLLRCPSLICGKITVHCSVGEGQKPSALSRSSVTLEGYKFIKGGHFFPEVDDIREIPNYVPTAIREDIYESCKIEKFSPKASATLIRRALQGMIRDHFSVTPGTLFNEIKQIEDKVTKSTFDSIDAVRKIGNIGAHMEKDVNIIIDVEPEEARLLIELAYSLVQDWYVHQHESEERKRKIIELAQNKK